MVVFRERGADLPDTAEEGLFFDALEWASFDPSTSPAARAVASRRTFLRRLAAAGGVGILGGAALDLSDAFGASAPSAAQDRKIFNFALLVEDLKAQFYREALAKAGLRGELRRFAELAGNHEQAHADFLRRALGRQARQRTSFSFGNSTQDAPRFASTALELEELAVAAYNGQAANLTKKGLAAAIKIVSVEARHAAWIRDIVGKAPAPRAADPGQTADEVATTLKRLHIK
jgi:rubrerythrin